MICNLVPFGGDSLHNFRVRRCALAEKTEGRLDLFRSEKIEQLRCVVLIRAIVKGDGDVGPIDVDLAVGRFLF